MRDIRDPIHGYVKLDPLALDLISTPQVQRLRWIKQLGLAVLVYPGANHSRFEHSLGTYHLAGLLAGHLGLNSEDGQKVRAAALLHDLGHGPFSHATEGVLSSYLRREHEKVIDILREREVREVLSRHGLGPQEVQQMIMGQTELGKMVSGEIDVDRMDYLIRDAHYTGVAYGVIDHLRLMERMMIYQGRLVIDGGGMQAAEALLVSRLLMRPTVYYHHVCRISECMLSGAIRHLIEEEGADPRGIKRMDDMQLMAFMNQAGGYAEEMAERIKSRRLFKRAVYAGRDSIPSSSLNGNPRRLAEEIAGEAGLESSYVLVDLPPPAESSEGSFMVFSEGETKALREVSPLVSILERAHRATWRFGVYTLPESREAVIKAAERCLNIRKHALQHTFADMDEA
ncbi:MAG: HD domain-containing protein [Methanosarcinales archaeon]|nr:HD domain-containing protein [Methanosarcinales archaeon]